MDSATSRQKEIAKKYVDASMRDHVLKKDMWTGPRVVMEDKLYVADSIKPIRFSYDSVKVSPALEKIVDEIVVNVVDHRQRNMNKKGKSPVTYLNTWYKDGQISIENDGPGMEVEFHPALKCYVPQMISTVYLKGENLNKKSNDITGGTNGLGMKLTNTYSKSFTLETFDSTNKKLYIQHSHDNMSVIDPPIITSGKDVPADKRVAHTRITFTPDYPSLGYKEGFVGTDLENDFLSVLRTRLILIKMYMRDMTITFNGEEIILPDLATLARAIFGEVECFSTIVKDPSDNKYHWEVCAVATSITDKSMTHFTNVNGVYVRNGSQVKWLYDQVYEKLKTKMTGAVKDKIKMTKALLYSNLVLFINSKIPNDALSWDGQRKDICSVDAKVVKQYKFNTSFINKIAIVVKEMAVHALLDDNDGADWTAETNKKKDRYEKYTPAENIRYKNKKKDTRLIFPEGDSAETMVRSGIALIGGFKRNGICNLGGNIVNARKEIQIIKSGNKEMKVLSKKLKDNALFKFITQHTGLNISYSYDPESATYEKEMSELKYGCFVACVDQDLDGVGKIFSLFLNIFHLFWPNLLKQGYVKRFETPIIRVFKNGNKKKFVELYDDFEYKQWLSSPASKGNWTTKYYKGLAGHERPFVQHMYRNFDERLYTYRPDEKTDELFDIYFGKDPDKRKEVLSSAVDLPTPDEKKLYHSTKEITLSMHLNVDTKSQKLSNVNQKLHDVVGGMNEAGRKIYCGSYQVFKNTAGEIKVAQLTGAISQRVKYHHGEASLENSIKQKAFVGIGGKQLPVFIPESSLGSRLKGGKDAGSARYVYVRFNKDLMNIINPPADNFQLNHIFDEGVYVEPKFYKPIVPMAILESICMPADGWQIQINARRLDDVINVVKKMIVYYQCGIDIDEMAIPFMRAFIDPRFKGSVIELYAYTYTIGCYETNMRTNTVTITELPIGVWNDTYCKTLEKKVESSKYVVEYQDHSSDTDVNIVIKVTPDFWNDVDSFATYQFDGITEFFLLRDKMNDGINFIMPDGSVKMFDNYQDPLRHWFPIRWNVYVNRYEHDITLLELKIKKLQNEIRYSKESPKYKLHTIATIEEAIKILDSHDYAPMNHKILSDPGSRLASELYTDVIGDKTVTNKINFDYLLDIRDRDRLNSVIVRKTAEVAKLQSELDALHNTTPPEIWKSELDKLLEVYTKGITNNWGVDFDT